MTSFTRALVFTDIHFGKKSDSETHNRDCLDFIDWIISEYHANQCDAVIFLGDWFHNRVRVQWDTIWYSEQAIERLSQIGCPIYFCLGNHDLWFNDNRSIHAHPNLHRVPNFIVINSILKVDDCLFCPYLMGSEYNIVTNTPARYLFGHFEFPGFLTNETYLYESHDALNSDYIAGPEYLFSGHFHKRQIKANQNGTQIVYIGNCFAHDWNDSGDRNRGCMIFEREEELRFLNWPDAPSFHKIPLSRILDQIEVEKFPNRFNSRTVLHLDNDIQLSGTDLTDFRNWLGTLDFREIKILPGPDLEQSEAVQIDIPHENIISFFMSGLNQIDTEGSTYQPELLRSIFQKTAEKIDNGKAV